MLFDRVYRLLVGKKGQKAGLEITNLRITFDIQKSSKKDSNKSKISVWNLTKDTRAHFEEPNTRVVLYAGYSEDAGPLMIFQGDVTFAYTNIATVDRETIFELGDGFRELRDSVISVGYGKGVDSKTIIQDVSKSMNIPLTMPEDAPNRIWENGFSFTGSSHALADKITHASGNEWSIQNGNMQVIEKGGVTTRQGILISSDSGMVGSPVRVRKAKTEKAGNKTEVVPDEESENGWRVNSLLQPTLNPGDRIELDSEVVSGIFRIESLKHKGDSHGGDWQTELNLVDPNKPIEKKDKGKKGKGKKGKKDKKEDAE